VAGAPDGAPDRHVAPLTGAGAPEALPGGSYGGLLAYIGRMSGRQQIVICTLAVLVAALETVPLEIQRRIVNRAIGDQDLHLLALLGIAFFVATLIQGVLKYALRVYGGAVSEDVILNARRRLYAIATRQRAAEDAAEADARPPQSGRAVSVIGREIDDVGSFVGEGIAEPLVQGGIFVGLLGYMLVVEPLLAGISLALFAPQAALLPWVQATVNRLVAKRVRLMRAMGDDVAESTILAHAGAASRQSERFAAAERRFHDQATRIRDNRVRIFWWQYLGKALVNVFAHLGPLTVLMVGGYMVIRGQTSLGIVVAFVSGFERLAEPARELAAFYQLAATTRVQFETIGEWMDAVRGRRR
jgi:ABC-type multidrug transport system fused ATPase/permease subunit